MDDTAIDYPANPGLIAQANEFLDQYIQEEELQGRRNILLFSAYIARGQRPATARELVRRKAAKTLLGKLAEDCDRKARERGTVPLAMIEGRLAPIVALLGAAPRRAEA